MVMIRGEHLPTHRCHDPPMRDVRDRFRRDAQLRLATLTAACLLAEAVVAKNLLEVRLDPFSQIAPFWVYLVAVISGEIAPRTERGVAAAIVAVTVGVLVLYAL